MNQVQKKTKVEEKDDLIEKTKKTVIDKYGVRHSRDSCILEKISRQEVHADNCRYEWVWVKCNTAKPLTHVSLGTKTISNCRRR